MAYKIIVTGPESTGKTTLTQALSAHYQIPWVREYARIFIDHLHRPYQEDDLLTIAKGQLASEEALKSKTGNLLLCDTGLEVIKIWSEVKYRRCHPWILEKYRQQRADLYLLCAPDFPWEHDVQRENPGNRDELFAIYQRELQGANLLEIRGTQESRLQTAIQAIDLLVR